MLNNSQISGVIDRVVIGLLMLAVGRGWMSDGDAHIYAPAIGLAISAVWGAWRNRNKSLLERAATVQVNGEKTQIVAPKALAESVTADNVQGSDKASVVKKQDTCA